MSEIQKCPNLVRGGGVSIFQKCLKFKNVPKVGGGGSTLIGTLSQIFLIFYFDGSPKCWKVLPTHLGEIMTYS